MAGGQLFDDAAYVRAAGVQRAQQPSSQASPQSHLNGDQLKAFMTPREILGDRFGDPSASYQGLEGDHHLLPKNKANARESEKQMWGRKLDEAGLPAADYRAERNKAVLQAGKIPAGTQGPTDSYLFKGAPAPPLQHPRMGTSTYEDILYEHDDAMREHIHHRIDQWTEERTRGQSSLYEHVASHGVEGPIPLQSGGVGSLGKPQLLGGHHRVASQHHINADQFMPVVHHDVAEADEKALDKIKRDPYTKYS